MQILPNQKAFRTFFGTNDCNIVYVHVLTLNEAYLNKPNSIAVLNVEEYNLYLKPIFFEISKSTDFLHYRMLFNHYLMVGRVPGGPKISSPNSIVF